MLTQTHLSCKLRPSCLAGTMDLQATTGATLWYMQTSGKIDLWPHIEKMDKIRVKADGKHGNFELFWTISRGFLSPLRNYTPCPTNLDYTVQRYDHACIGC